MTADRTPTSEGPRDPCDWAGWTPLCAIHGSASPEDRGGGADSRVALEYLQAKLLDKHPHSQQWIEEAFREAEDLAIRAATPAAPSEPAPLDVERLTADSSWPGGLSNGLSLACADCGERPRFDYHVTEDFWRRWVPDDARLGVVCLPCLDRRCRGVGLVQALESVQWTGTGHTVVLSPSKRYDYAARFQSTPTPTEEPT